MEAERRLLISALAHPGNQRFTMLSESCMFLYPPAVVWLESFRDPRSRVNACTNSSRGEQRRVQNYRCAPAVHPVPETNSASRSEAIPPSMRASCPHCLQVVHADRHHVRVIGPYSLESSSGSFRTRCINNLCAKLDQKLSWRRYKTFVISRFFGTGCRHIHERLGMCFLNRHSSYQAKQLACICTTWVHCDEASVY